MRSNVTSISQPTKNTDKDAISNRSDKKFIFNNFKSHSTFWPSNTQNSAITYNDYFLANMTPQSVKQVKLPFESNKAYKIVDVHSAYQTLIPSNLNMRSKTEDSMFHENPYMDKIKRLRIIYTPQDNSVSRSKMIQSHRCIKKNESLQLILEKVKLMLKKYSDREEQYKKRDIEMHQEIDILRAKLKTYEDNQTQKHEKTSSQTMKPKDKLIIKLSRNQ